MGITGGGVMDRYEIGDYGSGMVPYDGGDWVNADEADKEIESLKVENNNLLVMVSNQQKEIESLRQRNERLDKQVQDLINIITRPKLYQSQESGILRLQLERNQERGDEWKRRAQCVLNELPKDQVTPSMAEWFEEE